MPRQTRLRRPWYPAPRPDRQAKTFVRTLPPRRRPRRRASPRRAGLRRRPGPRWRPRKARAPAGRARRGSRVLPKSTERRLASAKTSAGQARTSGRQISSEMGITRRLASSIIRSVALRCSPSRSACPATCRCPTSSQTAERSGHVSAAFAPRKLMNVRSPPGEMATKQCPVACVGCVSTNERSTPACRAAWSAMSAPGSRPTAVTSRARAPSLASAVATFAPEPPLEKAREVIGASSPSCGKRVSVPLRSALASPMMRETIPADSSPDGLRKPSWSRRHVG